jgi:hypothetical protein
MDAKQTEMAMARPVVGLIAVAVLAAMLGMPSRAQAEEPYPWCAEYNGDEGGGGTNCGFVTFAQCRASISGVGGTCYENRDYPGPAPRQNKKAAKKNYKPH